MTDVGHERNYVASLYSGKGWKKKVAKMTDSQVLAIYLREKRKPKNQDKPNPKEEPDVPF